MSSFTRRGFIKQLGTTGVAASVISCTKKSSEPEQPQIGIALSETLPLGGTWLFKLDPQDAGEIQRWHSPETQADNWKEISVPHTWQVSPESADYLGAAWYRKDFEVPRTWAERTVRIEFEAVYHSASVWLNGKPVGKHLRKGYTAFAIDISSVLRPGEENTLIVRVDNSFDQNMLPRGNSFDWTTDGGIIRPVTLMVTPKIYIERVDVDTLPDLEKAQAEIAVKLLLKNNGSKPAPLQITYRIIEEESGRTVFCQKEASAATINPGQAVEVILPQANLSHPRLWHFDHPHLYRLEAEIGLDGKPLHSYSTVFGVRKIEVRDCGFYLNGERVWLMGVERMAGSHPDYGMAEPLSWIVHDHEDLKELNCVFTRVHWPQDRRVLDYCDRHGILIQTEVPSWGPDTFKDMGAEPAQEIMQNGLEQLAEMISRDRNHPCIFAWGLCNEVDGQNPPAYEFVKRMYERARQLDPLRLLSYASNTLQQNCAKDAAGLMDFIEWNEYYETWYKGTLKSVRENLEEIHRAFPEKMVVISEYGYCQCTPDRKGGDARLIEILRSHTGVFRECGYVGGAIFFCYNDYRTHMGDKGLGVLKQRVHGVVDPYGERKPSFQVLRQESSPVETLRLEEKRGKFSATIVTRKTLPACFLEGYSLRWIVYGFENLPMEQYETALPGLAPGEQLSLALAFQEKKPRRIRVDIIRPTGFSSLTAHWKA